MSSIRVLVVDDSKVIREIIVEALKEAHDINVVGEAADPFEARELIKQLNPDILTLDVEMPKMDGITFLRNLMKLRPMPVVMLSTLTTKGADITLEALEIGAVDFIAKPSVNQIKASLNDFKTELINKIKQAAKVDQKNFKLNKSVFDKAKSNKLVFSGVKRANHLIAIGASTGGTEAIKQVLQSLPQISPPIVITQHIPKNFSARFAQRLDSLCTVTVQEAQHGQKVKTGNVYIAPGDQHLKMVLKNGSMFCTLEDSADVNRHKPSVDVLFDSLVPYADNVQAVLLTGMGQDGAKGMLNLKQNGAFTIIQDQASSLIWGMPGKAHALSADTIQSDLSKIAFNFLHYASLDLKGMEEVRQQYA